MKKIAAATLAATMALSLGAVDANAASNTMSNGSLTCNLRLDGGQGSGSVPRLKIKNDQRFAKFTAENVGLVRTSSDVGEAFGSSDTETMAAANNAEAVQACIEGKNYQSQPMTTSKKVGIIAGTVISALVLLGGVLAPIVQPMIQQFLPR
mgnify:FL=1